MDMPQPSSLANPNAQRAVLTAGLVAGTLDILSACTQFYLNTGKNPVIVLKYVASGAFGATALSGGTAVAVWGLVFHFMIAFGFTIFFFLIYPRIPLIAKNKWITAIAYGLFAWLVMNLLVVPASQIPKKVIHMNLQTIIGMVILICMIGLPITVIIGNYFSKKKGTE